MILKDNTEIVKDHNMPARCCVCNRTYSDGEIGWTYRSFYKVYVCSTKCYEIAEGGWRDGKKIMVGGINVI